MLNSSNLIGLATPLKVNNFGTKLQAYAIQSLVSGLGFRVELIQYKTEFDARPHVIFRKLFSWKKTCQRIDRLLMQRQTRSIPELHQQLLDRVDAFKQFDQLFHRSAPIRGFGSLRKYARRYSAVICGSDQIWLPANLHAEFLTLEFVPENVRRISFAPSFGIEQLPLVLRGRYRRFLSQLNFTSVREESGKRIILELTGKEVPIVLDPTLTIDSQFWQQMGSSSVLQRPQRYILSYFLGTNPEHRKTVASIGKKFKLPVVCIPHAEEFCLADVGYSDVNLFKIGPVDFISIIQNATLVCTDSYHGTAFSISLQRQFLVFERYPKTSPESTNSRIYSLLGHMDLESRLVADTASAIIAYGREINYSAVAPALEHMRSVSRQFLSNSLANLR